MKKLKKALSLLLVAAMVFSFATTALATNYEDYVDYDRDTATTLECDKAVQAMTNLGIVEGNGNNDLQPTANFTRAQAARIITVMMLGTEKANALTATADFEGTFSDVSVDAWYAPYVQFCTEKGVIHGMGDGTYAPNATLTVNQWLVLLLGAIGVDTDKWVGQESWMTESYATALKYNVITADEYTLSCEGLDREYAILYAWRALNFDFNGGIDSMAETNFGVDPGESYTQTIYGEPAYLIVTTDGGENTIVAEEIYFDDMVENKAVSAKPYVQKGYTFIEDGIDVTDEVKASTKLGGRSDVVEVYDSYGIVVIKNEHVAVIDESNVYDFQNFYSEGTLQVGDVITYQQGDYQWVGGTGTAYDMICVRPFAVSTVSERFKEDPDKNVKDEEYVKLGSDDAVYFAATPEKDDLAVGAQYLGVTETYKLYTDAYGNIVYWMDYAPEVDRGTLVFVTQINESFTDSYDAATFKHNPNYTINYEYVDLTTGDLAYGELSSYTDTLGNDLLENAAEEGCFCNTYKVDDVLKYAYVSEDGILDFDLNQDGEDNDTYTSLDTNALQPYAKIDDSYILCSNDPTTSSITRIVYESWFQKDSYDVADYTLDTKIADVTEDPYETYVCYFMDETGCATQIYDITEFVPAAPAEPKENAPEYGMFKGLKEEVTNATEETQYYEFVMADGTTKKFPADPAIEAEYGALEFGSVYSIVTTTYPDETLGTRMTSYEPVDVTVSGPAAHSEFGYIHIGMIDEETGLATINSYKMANGVKFVNEKGKTVSIQTSGPDEHGVIYDGDTVDLYVVDDVVVFVVAYDDATIA